MNIPKNHERMRAVSEIFQEAIEKHQANAGTYYDDTAEQIAGHAIQQCMPELVKLRKSQIILESNKSFLIEGRRGTTYDDTHVQAEFARVALQPRLERIYALDSHDEESFVTLTTYDLFAIMKPAYVDPDPQDLVSGDELYVPFSDVQLFEPVS